jgi:DNA-binding response OmpR family regulator
MRLLIVEDEPDILTALQRGLKQEGYAVDAAATGEQALESIGVTDYDLILLDINLPDLSGLSIIKSLRDKHNETRIMIVSANKSIDDRIRGLDLGANDYMVKPFDFGELCAHIRALLRRNFTPEPALLVTGKLSIDQNKHRVTYDGAEIVLTKKEYEILAYLMRQNDRMISAEELLEHVWDEDADPFSQVIRVHIYSLRKKLSQATGGKETITTLKGVGYGLNTKL